MSKNERERQTCLQKTAGKCSGYSVAKSSKYDIEDEIHDEVNANPKEEDRPAEASEDVFRQLHDFVVVLTDLG